MINFSDYPYLKDKKELLDNAIDSSFNYIIDTYFSNKYKITDDFIVTFITDLKKKLYLYYRNNKIATITDDDISSLFFMYLTLDLVDDIPQFNYYYNLSRNILSKISDKGGFTESVTYEDSSTDTSNTTSSISNTSTSNREGKATSSTKDDTESLSKNADTPTLSNPSSSYVDTYSNNQQKDTSSNSGSSDTSTSSNDTNKSEGTSTTDKEYSRNYNYNKNIDHQELESLSKELDNISRIRNKIVTSYITTLSDCFITLEDLYDLYEGDDYK